jgi:Flp pilus assembly protein TadG
MTISLLSFVRAGRALRQSTHGMAAVEFALTAPVLILLYLGTFQITDAIAAKRKVAVTTRTLADLTTQYTSLSSSEADAILAAATQVMAPYDPSPGTFIVSEIYIDNAGAAKIAWSRARNGTARTVNSAITLPTGISQNNSYVILAETSYQYTPGYTTGMIAPFAMKDAIYMYPRRSNKIDLQ